MEQEQFSIYYNSIVLYNFYHTIGNIGDKLWDKLGKMGIKGKLLECMQSIYEDVKCTVKLGEECGKSFVYNLAYAKDAYYLPCCLVCI